MTLRTRLERGIVVLLAGMPRLLQRLLAGRPREVDGQRLEPEVQLMLRLLELSGPALEELPVPEAREQLAHNAAHSPDRLENACQASPLAASPATMRMG